MKKIIILLFSIILLTGCEATYEINFNKTTIKDSIKISTDSKIVQKATNQQTNAFQEKIGNWERGYEYYKRELYADELITGYQYTYDFKYNEYDAMSQIRKCYKNFNFTYENNKIIINTSNEFLCKSYYEDIPQLKLTISSEYKILSSNADNKNNNKHTWIINKQNYKNKPIEIQIDKTKEYKSKKNKEKVLNTQSILTIIIFILLILVYIVRKKDEKKQ